MASTDLPNTLVQRIACNVLSVAAAAIPLEVVEHTKALILDSIGCALAATEEPAFARASRVLAQLGGNPDCTVIGSSRRVNLPHAVLLNGILIRSLDLNDVYLGPGQMGHPSDNIAVALSVGEKFRASGLSVIAGVALGYEIYCRMQDIIPARVTWDHTTASALAAPLIAGRFWRLLFRHGRPDVFHPDGKSAGGEESFADRIFQFPDIARPRLALQEGHGLAEVREVQPQPDGRSNILTIGIVGFLLDRLMGVAEAKLRAI